jgi:adenine-specific DNA-methyltransferase
MPIKYIPYDKTPVRGEAILNNITRTRRILSYKDNDKAFERILRGIPYYELNTLETVGKESENLIIRGECLSACAYLKNEGIKVDLVYIDPPFASGADYAKKVYIRKNPLLAEKLKKAEEQLEFSELVAFEEKMYGDIWNKEDYLNWMFENLMAIKEVMSDIASIYVHLDENISHYVKILMDEVFGEENFRREIIWDIQVLSGFKTIAPNWIRGHDTIFYYVKNNDNKLFHKLKQPHTKEYESMFTGIEGDRKFMVAHGLKRYWDEVEKKGKPFGDVWSDIMSYQQQPTSSDKVDYVTQKPNSLLERIIKASSNENMVVADFFGGSGVTAKVASDLGRKFIHCDIGINSIQTVRDRLVEKKADFKILEVQDGINLFRNPIQTMEKLKTLLQGINPDKPIGISSFWYGYFIDSKYGTVPVYVPDIKDSTKKVLDIVTINEIVNRELYNFDDYDGMIRKVVVYYIDVEDMKEIEKFIKENNETLIDVELRDLKQILDFVVVDDIVEFTLNCDGLFYEVKIDSFYSDRLKQKINDFNAKKGLLGKATLIEISKEGLELIEYISLDCTNESGVWQSDTELKIDKNGFVIVDGNKTKEFWNAKISATSKPKRIKVRNIAGDEIIYSIE